MPGGILSSAGFNKTQNNSASQLFRMNNLNKYKKLKEKEDDDEVGYIPPEEIEYVEALLDRFIIPQDTSNAEQINIKLTMKCLPSKVQEKSFKRIELINFKSCKLSLIAFQMITKMESSSKSDLSDFFCIFEYYSSKNKRMLFSLKKSVLQVENEIKEIREHILKSSNYLGGDIN